jgi:AcrR family transcriptional regulator
MTEATTIPVAGRRERKKAQTRDAIIDAAIDLFERRGYDATTVEQIADAADVSERTFFRYFDSKLDVVLAAKGTDASDLEAQIAARPAGESPLEATRQVIRAQLLDQLGAGDLVVRQFRVVMGTPSLRPLAFEHFNEHRDELATVYAARLGVPADDLVPQVFASAVGGAIWTVINRWVDEGAERERLLPLVDEAFGLLEQGLG